MVPVLLTAVVLGIAVMVPTLLLVLLASLLPSLQVPVAILIFIVPIIIVCSVIVAVPACVVERIGAFRSFSRSLSLTKGCRLKIFLLLVLLGFLSIVVISILWLLLSALFAAVFNTTGMIMAILIFVGMYLVLTLPMTLQTVFGAVLYYDLRRVKEGVSVDSLANVFD